MALGLLEEAIIEGRIRGGLLAADDEVGAGERGVEAFLVPVSAARKPFPGEEDELMMTGRRSGESRLYGRETTESEDATLEGEVPGEVGLLKSDGAVSRASCFDGDDRMLLPEALRGDLDGDVGGGILIESKMAANAAFSGDIGFVSMLTTRFRSGD